MTMETKIDQILKIVTMNQQDIADLKKDVKVLKEDVAVLKKDVKELKEEVAELKERVAKLEERMTSVERSVAIIEYDHGNQIRALFDYMKTNDEAHQRIENSISTLKSEIQATLFNHEKRIKKLEGNLVPVL